MKKIDFKNTKKALDYYDSVSTPFLNKLLDHAANETQIKLYKVKRQEHSDLVRKAFFEDTKDINSLDHCMIVDITWLRELVKKYGKS